MDLNLSVQDNPESTLTEARRHRAEIGIIEENITEQRKGDTSLSEGDDLLMYGQLNPTIRDLSTELTEDDIFQMKNIRQAKSTDKLSIQSAVSVVDSASNSEECLSAMETATQSIKDANAEEEEDSDNSAFDEREMSNIKDSCCAKRNDDYVFNRNPICDMQLNKDTVTELRYPFMPAVAPPFCDLESFSAACTAARVFLVGTAHFSPDSQNDVRNAIIATQPDIVMVELCMSRIAILSMNEELLLREARKLNYNSMMAIIRQNGFVQGMLHILLLSTSANLTRQLGMAPGGEFRAAHKASRDISGCQIVLGDRPIQITLQRVLGSLSFFQMIRLFFRILISNSISITQKDVEQCKNKDLLEELLKDMAGEFPQLAEILVHERDIYMTYILHQLLYNTTIGKWQAAKRNKLQFEPVNIVAVVGIGHVSGIVENWGIRADCSALLIVPSTSRTTKVVKGFVRCAIIGVCAYGIFRIAGKIHHIVKSS